MKTLLNVLCLLVCTSIYSQSNNFNSDTIIYVTPKEEAYMIDKETKSLFKISPFNLVFPRFQQNQSLTLGYEFKLSPSFSLEPYLNFDMEEVFNDKSYVAAGLELKFFPRMKRILKKGDLQIT